MNRILLGLVILGLQLSTFAQNPDSHQAKPYTDSTGVLYWNQHQAFFLRIGTSERDTGVVLKSNKQTQFTNPGYFDEEGMNIISTKFAVDPVSKKRVNPAIEIQWNIIADGTSPKTQISFGGAVEYSSQKKVYFGPSLNVQVTSQDKHSGVENIFIQNSNGNFEPYKGQLYFDTEGEFKLTAYAVDRVGNAEKPITKIFTVDRTAPESKYEIHGPQLNEIINIDTKIELFTTDTISGIKNLEYKIDELPRQIYKGGGLPTANLEDGQHTVEFFATDNVLNIEKVKTLRFYLDKLPPIITSDVLGDRFIVNDQIYFSGRTKLKLTSVDNKSGIKDILFSIDSDQFGSYTQPFYLPSKPGIHIVRFFAIDKMDNMSTGDRHSHDRFEEYRHNVNKIYVDLTGPTLSYEILGPKIQVGDTTFLSKNSRIKLGGTDGESGMNYLSYSINQTQAEETYTVPFSLSKDGVNYIEIFGYDNVNNRNRDDFTVIIDNQAPEIFFIFSIEALGIKEELPILSKHTKLYLAATDEKVGTKEISYSVNGSSFVPYTTAIGSFRANSVNTVIARAIDMLANEKIEEIRFWLE